jgi:hypothetical protein
MNRALVFYARSFNTTPPINGIAPMTKDDITLLATGRYPMRIETRLIGR